MSIEQPVSEGKYARVERERRFLLPEPPRKSVIKASLRITDRYLPGTRLRLRRIEQPDIGTCEYKFTQKVPADRPGHLRGLITTTYLAAAEYELLSTLPADVLTKHRLSVPPLGIDVFDPPLHGLVIAEAEFATDAAALAFPPPAGAIAEITDDPRFAGGNLARTGRRDLLSWLSEYGL